MTINEHSVGRTLPVFVDPESAYMWLHEATQLDEISDVDKVALLPGEFIEAEWRGCEFAYEGHVHSRLDLCRFAKASPSENASGLVISTHYGWVHDCILPFRNYKDEDIEVVKLDPNDERIDLTVLFKDDVK